MVCLMVLSLAVTGLTACGNKEETDTKVVLTTGFHKDEVFRIEKMSCTLPEIMVYLTTTQNQYESVYGDKIWEADLNGVTLEENVKETVLANMAQVKTMNLLAKQHQVTLSEEETDTAKKAAAAYYGSLNETEISQMGITEETTCIPNMRLQPRFTSISSKTLTRKSVMMRREPLRWSIFSSKLTCWTAPAKR